MKHWSVNSAGLGTGIEKRQLPDGQRITVYGGEGGPMFGGSEVIGYRDHAGLSDEDLLDLYMQCRHELLRRKLLDETPDDMDIEVALNVGLEP